MGSGMMPLPNKISFDRRGAGFRKPKRNKMNLNKTVLLLAGVLALSACGEQPAGSGQAQDNPASQAAAASQTDAAPQQAAVAELKSNNQALTVKTAGEFTDKLADKDMHPDGVSAEQLILLQHNESDNITVYAADFGQSKHSAADYFAKLKKALENNKDLKDLQINQVSEARLDYRFSQDGGSDALPLNESCAALVAGGQVYGVCASSPEISTDALAAVLNDISVRVVEEAAASDAASAASAS